MSQIIAIANFNEETNRNLRHSAEKAGFNLSRNFSGEVQDPANFDFHITVFATKEENHTFKSLPKVLLLKNPITIIPKTTGTIGIDNLTPCIFCEEHPRLLKMRNIFEDFGYTFTFDDWKPHISLSYNTEWDDLNARLFIPEFPLIVDRIKLKEFHD